MLTYDLEKRGGKPIYEYLYLLIREDIRTGIIGANEKLPSKRRFAEHLGVSIITVKNAYEQLIAEGYITSRERGGYFAADLGDVDVALGSASSKNKVLSTIEEKGESGDAIDLTSGSPDPSLFPFSVWSKLMRRVLAEQDKKLLQRVPAIGVRQLREAIAENLFRTRGLVSDPECIVIGAGTEYLYNLIVQLLGRHRIFAIEEPGYKKLAEILERCGVSYQPVELDEYGMKPDVGDADVIHLSPSHHFPLGLVMPAPRRREIIKSAELADGYVIEDDYDSEFRFEGKMTPTLFSEDSSGRVIYMNTFAETISPSLRISYMILPPVLMDKFRRELSFYSCTVPSFEQYTLAAFISEGYFEKHVNRMRLLYKQRRDEVLQALEECRSLCAVKTSVGMNIPVRFQTELSDGEVKEKLLSLGVKMKLASDYLCRQRSDYAGIAIVNFAHIDTEKVCFGIKMLEKVVNSEG